MKKDLDSFEKLVNALKLGKSVYREEFHIYYKMVDGIVCAFTEEGCLWVNAQISWNEDYSFYTIGQEADNGGK